MTNVKQLSSVTERNDDVVELERHPLQFSWNFFVFSYTAGRDWNDNMQKIDTFDTVEHFWRIFNHILSPSEIANGTDLYVFKEGIKPMWEDPKNEHGGRWLINVNDIKELNRYWEELLMLIVGNNLETEEDAEDICGIVFQPRSRGIKISLWTANSDDEESIMRIGRRVKEILSYPARLFYQTVHQQQNMTKGRDSDQGKFMV